MTLPPVLGSEDPGCSPQRQSLCVPSGPGRALAPEGIGSKTSLHPYQTSMGWGWGWGTVWSTGAEGPVRGHTTGKWPQSDRPSSSADSRPHAHFQPMRKERERGWGQGDPPGTLATSPSLLQPATSSPACREAQRLMTLARHYPLRAGVCITNNGAIFGNDGEACSGRQSRFLPAGARGLLSCSQTGRVVPTGFGGPGGGHSATAAPSTPSMAKPILQGKKLRPREPRPGLLDGQGWEGTGLASSQEVWILVPALMQACWVGWGGPRPPGLSFPSRHAFCLTWATGTSGSTAYPLLLPFPQYLPQLG